MNFTHTLIKHCKEQDTRLNKSVMHYLWQMSVNTCHALLINLIAMIYLRQGNLTINYFLGQKHTCTKSRRIVKNIAKLARFKSEKLVCIKDPWLDPITTYREKNFMYFAVRTYKNDALKYKKCFTRQWFQRKWHEIY